MLARGASAPATRKVMTRTATRPSIENLRVIDCPWLSCYCLGFAVILNALMRSSLALLASRPHARDNRPRRGRQGPCRFVLAPFKAWPRRHQEPVLGERVGELLGHRRTVTVQKW